MTDRTEPIRASKLAATLHIPLELIDDTTTPRPPMTAHEAADYQKRRDAERAQELAAADAEWHELRERFHAVPAIKDVLELHRPESSIYGPVCTHPVAGWEADPEDWPCPTYIAIRDAQEPTT